MNDTLYNYVQDTENPEYNFNLAVEYEKLGQTASAISYYLRAADRSVGTELAYESLIRMAFCFNKQKNRWYTVKSLLHHAITVLPKRPEAYYILSRYEEWNKNYYESYSLANTALSFCNFDLESLRTNVEYPGKYGLIFEKAISSYWWGKSKECRELFNLLSTEYYESLDHTHKISVKNNFNILGMDFPHILEEDINKVKDFPSVYYLSLEESEDRRNHLESQFKGFNINKVNSVISKRFKECNDIIHGKHVHTLTDASKGCCTSHMRCIKKWLTETDEPYGFFCEDDISLETIKYWNFTWNEFIEKLPDDWECVQLMWVRDEMPEIKLRERQFNDWSATAYILKRERAQKIIDTYYKDEEFHFNIPDSDLQPIVENLVFSLGKVYTFPLFVEEVKKFDTCIINSDEFNGLKDDWEIIDGQGPAHIRSYDQIISWWKKHGNKLNIDNIPK
jgi:hypothetical protein